VNSSFYLSRSRNSQLYFYFFAKLALILTFVILKSDENENVLYILHTVIMCAFLLLLQLNDAKAKMERLQEENRRFQDLLEKANIHYLLIN